MSNTFVIIVTYNGTKNDWIKKSLQSLKNSITPVSIIVVDNGSIDNTVNYIKQNYEDVILLESDKNLGFGMANNLGLKKALELGGDYFFLLNQDACIQPNTITELLKYASLNDNYGILSPMHMNGSGTALDFNFSNYVTPLHCRNLYSDFVLKKIEDKVYESKFICAAAWLISKKCLKIVGGFSPTFFHYGEDDNYINRLFYKNFKIGVVPSAYIYHDRENSKKTPIKNEQNNKNQGEMRVKLLFSNPNISMNYTKHLITLIIKLVYNFIFFNKMKSRNLYYQISYLKRNKRLLKENLNRSISSENFVFIN